MSCYMLGMRKDLEVNQARSYLQNQAKDVGQGVWTLHLLPPLEHLSCQLIGPHLCKKQGLRTTLDVKGDYT